jgi:hypothetical protein
MMRCSPSALPGSNSLEPGWVPTKMGGSRAPDDIDQAHLTQAWLAAGEDHKANVTGQYFYHLKRAKRTSLMSKIAPLEFSSPK